MFPARGLRNRIVVRRLRRRVIRSRGDGGAETFGVIDGGLRLRRRFERRGLLEDFFGRVLAKRLDGHKDLHVDHRVDWRAQAVVFLIHPRVRLHYPLLKNC